jgi:hypothetical protein
MAYGGTDAVFADGYGNPAHLSQGGCSQDGKEERCPNRATPTTRTLLPRSARRSGVWVPWWAGGGPKVTSWVILRSRSAAPTSTSGSPAGVLVHPVDVVVG